MTGTLGRLYRGETDYNFISRRKIWYLMSGTLLVISFASLIFRGFNLGIDFSGGAVFQFPAAGTSVPEIQRAVADAGVPGQIEVQKVSARGKTDEYRVQTKELTSEQVTKVSQALAAKYGFDPKDISPQTVGAKWGATVTQQALKGLVFFLIAVIAYISMRFEPKMAAAAILALIHDIAITAGIYSVIGFEVTPSTVIAFLTILGYSLYDTVVVFDKVRENTVGLAGGNRMDYSQAANLSINQTMMRSINTSLTALLPVGSLLFVGAFLLGAGTLKDLALALFVGIATGAYSSIFVATPLLTEFKEHEPQYKALRARVQSRAAATSRLAAAGAGAGTPGAAFVEPGSIAAAVENAAGPGSVRPGGGAAGGTPRPRPAKNRNRSKGGRPGGGKKRR